MAIEKLRCAAVTLTMLAVALAASAADKKIARSALPKAVEKTVAEQSQGATVKNIGSETEDGVFQFEVEMMLNGHSKDIAVAKDGTLLEVEEAVEMNTLPAGVQSALTAKAADAKITKVESLTKKGTIVAYEAATLKGTRKGEIQVGPKGETLTHEE